MGEELILFIVLFVVLGGGGGALWFSLYESNQRAKAWKDAAAACGLQATEAPGFWQIPITAGVGRIGVWIEAGGEKGKLTRIVVKPPGAPDFHRLRIRPELSVSFRWVREIEIGDELFDQTFFIEGPAQLVLALLNAETRRLMLSLSAESRLDISDGRIEAEMYDEKVLSVLPLLLDLGQRFAQPMDVSWRLAENAQQDPEAGVRFQNLLLLIRELPEDPWTPEVLRTACSDPSPWIRLRAARELGSQGHGVLLKLAEGLEHDTVSAEAVSILDQELPFERASAILDDARGMGRIQTAHACLNVIGRGGAAAAVDVLAKVMAREENELAVVAAQALGETGNPAAEPWLILSLQREQKDLRVAAANALGRVGSVAAVLPLKEAAEGSWLDLNLRRAARQAVAEIQSRLQGASPGQLSLSGAEAGQLSLAQAEAGQLSITTDQGGQLSISDAGDKPGKD